MRRFLVFLLPAILGCTSARALEPDQSALAAQLASESVELVQNLDDGDQHVYCSGTWVSPHEILTADHCVEDTDIGGQVDYSTQIDVLLTPSGDESYFTRPSALTHVDPDHDLALLYVKDPPPHGTAKVSLSRLAPGQPVYAEGAPAGLGWSFSSGVISQIRYISDGESAFWYVQATTPISPGSSGGGLFDASGNLIGVTRMYVTRGENLNFFIHRDHIVAFLINAHTGLKT